MAIELTHKVVSELAAQVLRGEFNHISEESFTERLSDSDAFWKELVLVIKTYQRDITQAELELAGLIGTVRGIAFKLAMDAAPNIAKKLEDQCETEQAIEKTEAML